MLQYRVGIFMNNIKKYKVLITDYAWPNLDIENSILSNIAEIIVAPDTNTDTLKKLVSNVDVIMLNWAEIPVHVIREAKQCIQLSRFGVGIDNIPVKLATELGMLVTNIPDYCVDEVTDQAMALILSLNRQILYFSKQTNINLNSPVSRLRNQTLGLLGFGRQGSLMAKKGRSFGMNIITFDPFIPDSVLKTEKVDRVEFDELLSNSDFLSIHTPLNEDTKGLLGLNEFKKMKPTSYIVNVARGGIIQTNAITEALKENIIAGAGLDVTEPEPLPDDHPLRTLKNAILTPHTAFFSQESLQELSRRTAQQVKDVLEGKLPENLRNPEVLNNSRKSFSN